MSESNQFPMDHESVSQHEFENAVETLSNVLYLIDKGGDARQTQTCLEIAARAMVTLKRAARQGRAALHLEDRDRS